MKRRALIAAAAVVAAVSIAGCREPHGASDPRDGRVTLYADCNFLDGCYQYDWKVCVGPDLLTYVADKRYVERASAQCTPRPTTRETP